MNLVATLVRELKGTISFATGTGRFTRFTVSFPAVAAQGAAA